MKRILSEVRRTLQTYKMIEENDRIAVGISGGKDSMVLFAVLDELRRFYPQKYTLVPVYVDMGFDRINAEEKGRLHGYFAEKGYTLHEISTQIAEILFEAREGKDACSLCSKMRRGALCNTAVALGCNKLALGHHADDLVETFLMSLLYEGRLATFGAVSRMDKTGVSVIRPLVEIYEGSIRGLAERLALPILHNPCPKDGHTTREKMKEMVRNTCKVVPFAKDRMLDALTHPERNALWEVEKDGE